MGSFDEQNQHLMPNYGRWEAAFVRGEGSRLYDKEGREYLDFLAGVAVVNLGHAHPGVGKAVAEQAAMLLHVSNHFQIPEQAELARRLCEKSFADQVFFCNSGAEANEGALKLARLWASQEKPGAFEVVTTEGSFHGRTMFALSVTGQSKFHQGFEPLVPGIKTVPFDDLAAMEAAVGGKTAAVIVEPVQGEGGVRAPSPGYLKGLRELCDRTRTVLIFDEVQTGMGRLGKMFGYEVYGVEPDVMTLAKALGNGIPIGAVLARQEFSRMFTPGTHGSTFGGNQLACRAALAVLDAFEDGSLLGHVALMSEHFRSRLREVAAKHDCVLEVRGEGLLLGLALDRPGKEAVKYCLEQGMIINCTADRVLRFIPPLVITREEIDRLLPVLDQALAALEK